MIGQTVAHYRIDSRLGSGGMGIVYGAFDQQLQRRVALKFLPPHLSQDADAKQRFMQEARAASALDHANICAIHHIGETEDGQIYIVMPWYDGQTLKYRLQQGPLPEAEALAIARQVASGLARAHEAGIVHRDVKPANLMVTGRGEVRILDFGVAKLESSADLTKAGSTVGTAAYMSPEQARGERVGPAADQWSLGVVLHEMLSGRRPFDADYEQALVYAILNEDPPPVDATPETRAILSRLLAKRPEDRFATTAAAAEALGGSAVRPAPAPAPLAESRSGLGFLAGFAAVAVLVLALVYAAMMLFGLPDWVFALGVVLMAAGVPILWYADRVEDRRARLDSGDRRELSGLEAWLTVRRARWGGVVAMAGLAVVAAGWMGLRALGIGPAGTLVTRGVLSSQDRVVVAEFDDRSAQEGLGRTISEALRIDLAQSSVVSLLDPSEVRRILGLMQRGDATLDLETAREVARRAGAKAVVTGDIASLGSSYVLSLRLVDAVSGQELVPLRETADSDAEIVRAVDRLSKTLRERIGESLRSIRQAEALEAVSTRSLEALRQYTLGVAAFEAGDYAKARPALEAAIAADSTFAMAYRKLSVLYNNAQIRPDEMVRLARRAWELRDRLPRDERYYAEAWYYNVVEVDERAVLATYDAMLQEFPDDGTALNNAAVSALQVGEFERAERYTARAVRTPNPSSVYFDNRVVSLASTGRIDQARAALDSFAVRFPGHPNTHWWRGLLLYLETGDSGTAIDTLRLATAAVNDPSMRLFVEDGIGVLSMRSGRLADAQRAMRNREAVAPMSETALASRLRSLYFRLTATGDRSGLSDDIDAQLRDLPMESMPPLSRPYGVLAMLRAVAGQPDEANRLLASQESTWPEAWLRNDPFRHAARAMLATADGRPLEAVAALREARAIFPGAPRLLLFELASALVEADSAETAADLLSASLGRSGLLDPMEDMGMQPQAWRLLGDVSETLGRSDDAIEAYRRFVEAWAEADAELQPQVREAQGRIDRLLAARAREGGS